MESFNESRPASAAFRDRAESVEVRDARGRLVCRASADQAKAAHEARVGRLVAGGRVLRIRDARAAIAELHAGSQTTRRDRADQSCHLYKPGQNFGRRHVVEHRITI